MHSSTTVGIAEQSKLANYDKSAVLTHRCDALWSDSKEFVGGEVDGGGGDICTHSQIFVDHNC